MTDDSTCINDFCIALTAIFSFINELNEFWLEVLVPTGLGKLEASKTLNKFNSVELSAMFIQIISYQCDKNYKFLT